jgi:hypothetical protein
MAIPIYATVLSQINTYIVANGNNEITANVLNPILKLMLDFANNNIGDLDTLTTDEKNSVVEAINSLKQNFDDLVNNGVQLYTGIDDPNDVPPPTYKYADFYMQLDIDSLPVKLWQWNGFVWTDESMEPETDSDNVNNNSDVPGVSVTDALNNLNTTLGINATHIAWVDVDGNDTTAQIGNSRKAYLTIDAALDALPANGGVIKIGIGTFNSPSKAKIKENVAFIGSKKPITDNIVTITGSTTAPTSTVATKLLNGTILNGTFDYSLKDNITIMNLGIDVGSVWCTAFNGGNTADGLITAQFYNLAGGLPSQDGLHQLQTNSRPRNNIYVSNVIVLGKAPNAVGHAMQFENIANSHIENVSTYYLSHGLVIKGINVTLDGLDAHSHNDNGLIVKANDYAYCEDVNISNVTITSLNGYEGGGIYLTSENTGFPLKRINLSNVSVSYCAYGARSLEPAENINISGLTVYDTNNWGIKITNAVTNFSLTNATIKKTALEGVDLSSATGQEKNLTNVIVSDSAASAFKLVTTGTGVINVNNTGAYASTTSYNISGTGVFGDANFGSGSLIGSFRKNAIVTNGLTIDSGASNSIGGGSNIVFDNGLSGGSRRQFIPQLNASFGFDFWGFNGTTYVNSGTKINPSGDLIVGSLSGIGTRQVVADASGNLSASSTPIDSRPYKAYVSIFNQSGTSAPVSTIIFENNIGSIVWTRTTVGTYVGTLSGAFTASKVIGFLTNTGVNSSTPINVKISSSSVNTIDVLSYVNGVLADSAMNNMSLEIRVYN